MAKARGEGEAAVAAFERIIDCVTKHKKAKAILPSPARSAARGGRPGKVEYAPRFVAEFGGED